ncbi:hypothetical protein BEWA_008530 [Theileria equi strain WA]|uniref:Spindle pole body component n=1 Tax=Theileria equi strain WA TaxID=1537102 RepID=L0B1U2_THEEQ|nr:hypothetical protein BEWA_008530 [Theileria equi strain WA]AFZ81443.1 hypothetical protein BEWA_008530 [Theileria equi strain WA]|eukprot:XP_004831109.1 hypothetical protein BEWA_008530 [Theileria equi strain WA]
MEILKLAVYQRNIQKFITLNERSYVCQSISEVILNVLDDLQDKVIQFETKHQQTFLGLHRLKIYLQPALSIFELLNSIIQPFVSEYGNDKYMKHNENVHSSDFIYSNESTLPFEVSGEHICTCIGVELINKLYSIRKMFGPGDSRRNIVNYLFNKAMTSYTQLITQWMYFGILNDPYKEFFVTHVLPTDDMEHANANTLYDSEVVLDEEKIPEPINSIYKEIYSIGKYIRIIESMPLQAVGNYTYTSVEDLISHVKDVHQNISNRVMKFVMIDSNFTGKLESVYKFYLLSQSDFIYPIFDLINHEKSEYILQKTFRESLEFSSVRGDPRKDFFEIKLDNITNLPAALDYLSNGGYKITTSSNPEVYKRIAISCGESHSVFVFNNNVMYKYLLLFKYIFQLKYSEFQLSNVWANQIKTRELPLDPQTQTRFNFSLITRERMLFFVRTLLQHTCIDVVYDEYNTLCAENFEDLSELTTRHEQFLNNLLEESLLTNAEIFPVIMRTLGICNAFSKHMLKFADFITDNSIVACKLSGIKKHLVQRRLAVERHSKDTSKLLNNPGYIAMVKNANKQFEENVKNFMALLRAKDIKKLQYKFNFNYFF